MVRGVVLHDSADHVRSGVEDHEESGDGDDDAKSDEQRRCDDLTASGKQDRRGDSGQYTCDRLGALAGDGNAVVAVAHYAFTHVDMGWSGGGEQCTDENSEGSNSRVRGMDARVQFGRTAQTPAEWEVPQEPGTHGSGIHGCLRVAEGHVCGGRPGAGSSGNMECEAVHGGHDAGAHHAARDSSSSGGGVAHGTGEGLQGWCGGLSDRCNSSGKVHQVSGGAQKAVHAGSDGAAGGAETQAHSSAGGACAGEAQSGGRAEQASSFGAYGRTTGKEGVSVYERAVGPGGTGLVCGPVECAGATVCDNGRSGQWGDGDRCDVVPARTRAGGSMGLSSAIQKASEQAGGAGSAVWGACDSGVTGMGTGVLVAGTAICDGFTVAPGVQRGVATEAGGLQLPCSGAGAGGPVVDAAGIHDDDWRTYVGLARQRRGVGKELAAAADEIYKSNKRGERGKHLDKPFKELLAYLRRHFKGGEACVSDVTLCNVTAEVAMSESQAVSSMLSALRRVMEMAHGTWTKDKDLGKTVIAMGKSHKAREPRYPVPVDLRALWVTMQKQRSAVRGYIDASGKKLEVLKDHALFLCRHDQVSRSDDQSKIDYRSGLYCEVYDSDGMLVDEGALSDRLMGAVPDGFVEVRYKDPKDPRKTGVWSDLVVFQPLQVELLVDATVPHLESARKVEDLCAVRTLAEFARVAESQGRFDGVPEGSFWFSNTHTTQRGEWLVLGAERLAKRVKLLVQSAGIKMRLDDTEQLSDTKQSLAGHFVRGHAGSVAYTPAVEHGASWDPLIGPDRARHTLDSFYKSYSRGVVQRLVSSFLSHRNKAELRFESASRL